VVQICGAFLDLNIETIYTDLSLASYSVAILTFDKTNLLITSTQFSLITSVIKSALTLNSTVLSESLSIQTLKVTKQKLLTFEAQQLIISVQIGLEKAINLSVTTDNETEAAAFMEVISLFNIKLTNLGIET
jgi:hypothetical protein